MEITGRPARPTGLRRALFRAPIWLYRLHMGCLLGRRFVLINHVGRISGTLRQAVVEVVAIDGRDGAITVASGFGDTSDWYLNVLAAPTISVQLGSRRFPVIAQRLSPDEASDAMADYATPTPPRRARAVSVHGHARRWISRRLQGSRSTNPHAPPRSRRRRRAVLVTVAGLPPSGGIVRVPQHLVGGPGQGDDTGGQE